MGRSWLAWLLIPLTAGASGCLYLRELNERPVIEIVRRTTTAIERGATVELEAAVQDPDSAQIQLLWRAYACAATTELCDPVPFAESTAETFEPTVPTTTVTPAPVEHVRITLDATDDRGAAAQLPQRLDLDVVNASPSVLLQQVGRAAVVTQPVELRALRQDVDDGAAAVTLSWEVFPPAGSARPPLRPLPSADPAVEAQELTPDVVGSWQLRVTARDPTGATGAMTLTVVVATDRPPCLTVLTPSPIAPLLLEQRRRFAVAVVDDDLDFFPSDGGDGAAAQFRWSLLAPSRGAARRPLAGAVGPAVELDPATLSPGEQVELRVEVADRVARALPCAAAAGSCSIASDGCQQRQTWILEVR